MQVQHDRRARGWWVAAGLVAAAAVHGVFNILVLTQSAVSVLLLLLVVAAGFFWTLSRFQLGPARFAFQAATQLPQGRVPRLRTAE